MKKSYCGKYRKFKNPKISYIFEKTLVFSIICSNFGNEDQKIFKEEESIEILKFLVYLKIYKYFEKYEPRIWIENHR